MKALIVGYGSIGHRHHEVLKSIDPTGTVDLVTKQSIGGSVCFASLSEAPDLSGYDYYLVCSETSLHLEHLAYLEDRASHKTILVEKPIFCNLKEKLEVKRNRVFVGYNLRFHPVLVELKRLLAHEVVVSVNVQCGQFLPLWRPGTDYSTSYSASARRGGGVLRDLSHELDYLLWLFGPVAGLTSIVGHFSKLRIDSDDMAFVLGQLKTGANFSLAVDYLSFAPKRRIEVYTQNRTFEADLVNNALLVADETGSQRQQFQAEGRNYTYEAMHRAILSGPESCVATYADAIQTLALVEQIERSKVDYHHA